MADKNKKKKTYKKKYTSVRDDYRKGGRVKAQVGGLRKAPITGKKTDEMFIGREEEDKRVPTQPIIKPTVEPKRPDVVQPTQQTATTPEETSALKGTSDSTPQRKVPKKQTTEREAPTRHNFIGRKGSDQVFIGRADQETRTSKPTNAQKVIPQEDTTNYYRKAMKDNPLGKVTGIPKIIGYGQTGFTNVGGTTSSSSKNGGFGQLFKSISTDKPITGTPEQLAEERGKRVVQTGRTAEDIASGQIPEGTIPLAEAEMISTEGTEAPTVQLQPTDVVDATTIAQQTPEQIAAMEAVTAQTPEELQAAQMEAAQATEQIDLDAARGEVSDQAIAQAAGVERVSPIEGAEVEIPEGALTERVVGTISEGAKATAAMNIGTSLSRITRAKKQLSNAGLSDADIEEIGNDPEALEARLADFSEEQRGIIEGLPQEALVSTQMNNLLEGIESGEIPTWARPAVAQVEQMLAQRGMSASTVGRDSLFNAIIQSAMPIAQSNAQAIQSSVSQQRTIEAQAAEANAQRMQQTALTNAQNVFNMDMAQFSADQQTALSNSKFLQTVGLTEASNEQQGVIQNALLMSQANLAEADFYQKTQIQNAQAFLSMDMANLNNKQQANVLKAQQNQQRLLSNQSAQNAAAQFNAASENQTNQFMTNLNAQMNQYNASQMNAMEQFNATQANAAEARRAGREADIEKFNAQLISQVDQFNSQQDFARNQWNAQNAAAVEASNVQWRRQANTINTAAQNQINMQNAQNAFGLSTQAMSFLWQELRDQADFDFRAFENEENRKAQIIATAMANEGAAGERYDDYLTNLLTTVSSSYKAGIIS